MKSECVINLGWLGEGGSLPIETCQSPVFFQTVLGLAIPKKANTEMHLIWLFYVYIATTGSISLLVESLSMGYYQPSDLFWVFSIRATTSILI